MEKHYKGRDIGTRSRRMTKNVSARKEQEVKKGRDKKHVQKHSYSQIHEVLLRMFKS